MTRRLCIIPARGGSKRVPDKNIRDFCGKPMIAYVLNTVKASGLFDVIHVSTESEKVAALASELGFAPEFLRPAELADDFTPLMPVLKRDTETFIHRGAKFDQVWLLMACAPLIEANDLKGVAELFDRHGGRSPVLCVARYGSPVERSLLIGEDGFLQPVQPEMMPKRTQDFAPKYFDAGVCLALSAAHVLGSQGTSVGAPYLGYELPRSKTVDIDDQEDWDIAEALFRGRCS